MKVPDMASCGLGRPRMLTMPIGRLAVMPGSGGGICSGS